MTNRTGSIRSEKSTGDTAVDGLIAGIFAGVGMGIYLLLTGLLSSQGLETILGYFDPGQSSNWLTGLLAHLAVSGIYGVIFALLVGLLGRIRPSLFQAGWLWGLVYGLVLFGLARGIFLAAIDLSLRQIAPLHFAIAHVVYGLILGYWLGRNEAK